MLNSNVALVVNCRRKLRTRWYSLCQLSYVAWRVIWHVQLNQNYVVFFIFLIFSPFPHYCSSSSFLCCFSEDGGKSSRVKLKGWGQGKSSQTRLAAYELHKRRLSHHWDDSTTLVEVVHGFFDLGLRLWGLDDLESKVKTPWMTTLVKVVHGFWGCGGSANLNLRLSRHGRRPRIEVVGAQWPWILWGWEKKSWSEAFT